MRLFNSFNAQVFKILIVQCMCIFLFHKILCDYLILLLIDLLLYNKVYTA